MEKWFEILKFTIPAVVAVVGWFFSNWLSSKRELKNKRREIVAKYLIDAYRDIDTVVRQLLKWQRLKESSELDLELLIKTLIDVILFGSDKQIELVYDFLSKLEQNELEKAGQILDKLSFDLRTSLREELQLSRYEITKLPRFYTAQ